MLDQVRQQINELVTKDQTLGAIIMTPLEMTRFMSQCKAGELDRCGEGSGWSFEGLTIWRSFEIAGPTVVSREVFKVLERTAAAFEPRDPVLF